MRRNYRAHPGSMYGPSSRLAHNHRRPPRAAADTPRTLRHPDQAVLAAATAGAGKAARGLYRARLEVPTPPEIPPSLPLSRSPGYASSAPTSAQCCPLAAIVPAPRRSLRLSHRRRHPGQRIHRWGGAVAPSRRHPRNHPSRLSLFRRRHQALILRIARRPPPAATKPTCVAVAGLARRLHRRLRRLRHLGARAGERRRGIQKQNLRARIPTTEIVPRSPARPSGPSRPGHRWG
mmetsp:Transcript_23193/g.57518  ORF Transcript_23193/g.57518 Transcript_23193/m.57518 type:complete len:234 (+) Transcript_23193:1102-1803(+)